MTGADDDSAAWAAPLAELLAGQAAAAMELLGRSAAGLSADPDGAEAAWQHTAEQLEAQWRQFVADHTEQFVAAWPDIQRELTALLPLLSRMQPLFAMLVQVLPLLTGPQALGRAIESGGAALAGALEQILAASARAGQCPADEAPEDGPA